MAESICEVLLKNYPEFDYLHSTFVTNCVFNSFLCYTAIMLNVATICAITKTSSLPKPLKTLLMSVAVSDVGVGFIVEPFYVALLAKWLQLNGPGCIYYKAFTVFRNLFSIASFLNVVAVSVDRFLAIHLHLRYQELVTHKRVVAVVIFIWILSAFLSIGLFWIPLVALSITVTAGGVICLLVTTIVYCKIYLILRRHKNQIQALQMQEVQHVPRNGDMTNFARLRKSAIGVFYVYFVFLVCYFPRLIFLAARAIVGPSIVLTNFSVYSYTMMFLNSSLNPVIYCWKMRHIRRTIMDMLRNIICQSPILVLDRACAD